jgi:predicted Rossmann fold nucleotide-binding protein DprA/Smf involved in DNA uptake
VQELPESWRRRVRTAAGDGAGSAARAPGPEGEASRVLALLSVDEAAHIEAVIERAGLRPSRVAALLVELELAGWARQLEGQRWIAVAQGRPA